MKYHVEEIKHSAYSIEYRVLDENGVQSGESFWEPVCAGWLCEDLNAGKKKLTADEAFKLAFGITGEVEEARETGKAISVPEPKVVPVEENRDTVTIAEQHEVATIIEYRGESWLVTKSYEVTGYEEVHEEDQAPEPGWYSELFRVRDRKEALQVVVEQVHAGSARFSGPFTVWFTGEPHAHDMRTLVYSPDSGLHDKSQV